MQDTPSIDLQLFEKLRDNPVYRRRFFLAESSALIARQLIELRKRRGLSQKQLAALAETGQPAISRAERADYANWSFNTLRRLAEVMDARIRVLIEPVEDILGGYKVEEEDAAASKHSAALESPEVTQRQHASAAEQQHASAAEQNKRQVSNWLAEMEGRRYGTDWDRTLADHQLARTQTASRTTLRP